jgi:hypothetical protein
VQNRTFSDDRASSEYGKDGNGSTFPNNLNATDYRPMA